MLTTLQSETCKPEQTSSVLQHPLPLSTGQLPTDTGKEGGTTTYSSLFLQPSPFPSPPATAVTYLPALNVQMPHWLVSLPWNVLSPTALSFLSLSLLNSTVTQRLHSPPQLLTP